MKFVIDKNFLGTDKNLIVDNDSYSWSISLPKETWHLSGEHKHNPNQKCLDTLFTLSKIQLPQILEKYRRCMSIVAPSAPYVQWMNVMPQKAFKEYFKNVVSVTTDNFKGLSFEYYETVWPSASRVLNSLKPAKILVDKWKKLSESEAVGPAVETFRPGKTGYAAVPEYDRFGTRTGRLTVKSGPNIHVLKKENRAILDSVFPDGKICMLDFRSLEARVILYETGKSCESEDIYEEIAVKVCGGAPRDIVKTAVISELYGASKGSLSQRLQMTPEQIDKFVQSIRTYFETPLLRERLKLQLEKNGKICNRFGRPLFIDANANNLLVNTYAQSTGADVAMLGFDKILQQIGTDGIRPLFVLHDAIIIDIRGDKMDEVKSVNDVQVRGYDYPFPLKFELI